LQMQVDRLRRQAQQIRRRRWWLQVATSASPTRSSPR
jgi:hypothetical protein